MFNKILNFFLLNRLVAKLRHWQNNPKGGIPITLGKSGLNDEQLDIIQQKWEFSFPPDLRWLLKSTNAKKFGLFDWINLSEEKIRKALDWPLHGILFDVEFHNFQVL